MGCKWTTYGVQCASITLLILIFGIHGHSSLNSEGLALLDFRASVTFDPFGALVNWDPHESDHCMWSGVQCVDDKVQILDLNGCSLEGTLAPELGDLTYLKTLEWKNSVNPFRKTDSIFTPIRGTINRYFTVLPTLFSMIFQNRTDSDDSVPRSNVPHLIQHNIIEVSRLKLAEQSSNLHAVPANGGAPLDQIIYHPSSRSSGSFLAVPSPKNSCPPPPGAPTPVAVQPPPHNASSSHGQDSVAVVQPEAPAAGNHGHIWKCTAGISGGCFLIIFAAVFFLCRSKAARTINPWMSGLSEPQEFC